MCLLILHPMKVVNNNKELLLNILCFRLNCYRVLLFFRNDKWCTHRPMGSTKALKFIF